MTEWQKLVGGNFDRIVVESSPYTRTMMTAANICLGMGIPEFKVNYMFSEYQKSRLRSGNEN